jgi:hypothetical protein
MTPDDGGNLQGREGALQSVTNIRIMGQLAAFVAFGYERCHFFPHGRQFGELLLNECKLMGCKFSRFGTRA